MIEKQQKMVEYLSTTLLISVGVLGILVAALDFIGVDFEQGPWQWLKGPIPIMLLTVSALALALGLERITRFRQITKQISKLEGLIEKSGGGRLIDNYNEIYSEAIRMLHDAKRHIRTASINPDVPAPKEYQATITELLKQSITRARPILADMVINTDLDETPESIHNSWRVREFGKDDRYRSVNLYVVNVPWGFDLLVVDNQHMILTFPSVRGVGQLRLGLAFTNQPTVVREFTRWFDDFLLRKAIPYHQFLEKHPPQLPNQINSSIDTSDKA